MFTHAVASAVAAGVNRLIPSQDIESKTEAPQIQFLEWPLESGSDSETLPIDSHSFATEMNGLPPVKTKRFGLCRYLPPSQQCLKQNNSRV